MWSSRNKKSYQRIDDDYEDGDQRASACNSILPIVNTGRNMLFGGGPSHSESAPLISGSSTPGDAYNPPPSTHVVGSSRHDEANPTPPAMSSSSRRNDHRWDHIDNLDRFFTLVYEYHQGGGFVTIAVKKVFGLAQFVFVVTFSTFFMQCIDYDVLFANKNVTATGAAITGKRSFNRVLPPVFNVPFIGPVPYFPNGLKSNIRRILFFGSTSPWAGPYLKEEYKDLDNLELLTRQMEKDVAMYGLLNLMFFPLIFLYQILYSFFTLSELIRRRPDALGMRRYSNYGRYRVRHFNELNHELAARLNRSHVYANAYLNQFYSTLTEIFAKNIAFIAGAIAGVLAILSAWDEDVLQVEHVLTVISVCGVVMVVCHGMISDENLVWQPEVLLTHVTSELHYVPSEWKGQMEQDVSSAVHPGTLSGERNLLLDSMHSLVPSLRTSPPRNTLIGVGMDTAGADMRIQTLFLRGMHEESLRKSTATTTGYGASIAANQAQSMFCVPQLSQMDESAMPESDARSRLVLRSTLPGTSEEDVEDDETSQQDDDDNESPPQFMNV
ncbi:autophagy protein Apg9 [Necator americanus]|uniref:Autophagy-related protein 9 n=1 Tax=Necator americanus TaxID=51031 RepID=W2T9G0_NECAM|nr:autophagy protein Apg9 [Necator americanus]ETN77627.1 autophagy protein Apg9 [Necator americanus]